MVPIVKKKSEDFLTTLLVKNNLLIESQYFIKIDNLPDYELLPYQNNDFNPYIFANNYNYHEVLDVVYEAKFGKLYLFDFDSIMEICEELSIDKTLEASQILTISYNQDKSVFNDHKFDYERWEEIEFYKLRITGIDNTKKRIYYLGTFWGHTDSIDNGYYDFYCLVSLKGVSRIYGRTIYEELLIESYTLLVEEKYKQSFYIAYSAFENFINEKYLQLVPNETKNIRLEQKFDIIFNRNASNEIYSFIRDNLKNYTNKRNDIAHGNVNLKIEKKSIIDLLNLILSAIISNKDNIFLIKDLDK